MKKVYSLSISDKLIDIVDKHCVKTGYTRSELISNLLIKELNNGIDPEEIENKENDKKKILLLNSMKDLYLKLPELQDFIRSFELGCEIDESNLSMIFATPNRKLTCEIRTMSDSIRILARVNSSSEKQYGIFEAAFIKNRDELEKQGYKRDIYQRFWNLEHRHELQEYPLGDETLVLARFLLQKFLVLYTSFLNEFDFIVQKENVEDMIVKTTSLGRLDASDTKQITPKPCLEVLIGQVKGKKYRFNKRGSTIIGRSGTGIDLSEQEFNSVSPVVSKKHAELFWEEGKLFVKDIHSTNGTFVNNTKLTDDNKIELYNEDQILIANIELKVFI